MPPVDPETNQKLKPFIKKMQGQTSNELFPESQIEKMSNQLMLMKRFKRNY